MLTTTLLRRDNPYTGTLRDAPSSRTNLRRVNRWYYLFSCTRASGHTRPQNKATLWPNSLGQPQAIQRSIVIVVAVIPSSQVRNSASVREDEPVSPGASRQMIPLSIVPDWLPQCDEGDSHLTSFPVPPLPSQTPLASSNWVT